jgi:hypothetical protein
MLNVNGETYIAGPVGIGTFTPTGILDVRQDEVRIWTGAGTNTNATSAGELYVEGDLEVDGTIYGDGSGITSLPSGLAAGGWTDGGTNVYTSTTTDNVGIGTTTPTAALLVQNVGAQDSLRINDVLADGSPFIIDANGNVGVGTTTANATLQINDTGTGTTLKLLAAGGANIIQDWQIGTAFGSNSYRIQSNVGATGLFEIGYGGSLTKMFTIDGPNNNTYFSSGNVGVGTSAPVGGLVVMNGNVGIGTWSPTARLQVIGTVNATAFVGDGSGLTNLPTTGGWTDGGANVYTSTTTDNVGIGTTTPNSATLEIVKNAAQPALKVSSTATGSGDYFIVNSQGNVGIGTTTSVAALAVMNGNVGIGTFSPTSRFEVNGAMGTTIVSKSGNYTATINDSVIVVDASGGAVTITLPAAAISKGRIYNIKKTDASVNALIVDGNASETIDGALTVNTTTQYHAFTLVCDGANWWII